MHKMNQNRKTSSTIRFFFISVIVLFMLPACGEQEKTTPSVDSKTINNLTESNQYPNPDILADPNWLTENLGRDDLVIVDIREDEEGQMFIPGSVSLSGIAPLLDGDHHVDSFIIESEAFSSLMGELGISNKSTVVVYDEGTNLYAARLFYALDLYSHEHAMVLNGGFMGWTETGGPVSDGPAEPVPTSYFTEVNEAVFCDLETIQKAMQDENTVIFDVRSPDQYRGEWVRAERGGHIPGAVNLIWNATIYDEDVGVPWFRSPEDIAQQYEEHGITPDKEVIPHCHTNLHGSHAYFVLRLMGYESVRAYEGSWAEYGNRDGVPVAQ